MKGLNEQLEVGTCGHKRVFLFKCPTAVKNSKCVQCLVCALDEGNGYSCSAVMGDRPDYDELPELVADDLHPFFAAASKAGELRTLKAVLRKAVRLESEL